ncbi:GntR family transcriptional regulator [Oceanotoga sp. DSM 15011]|jgi:GntR family transcriptional regulator|uniref:GntR family transcriptional regulator n=1 Tax=Oceanotoga TaxID=1255275 RepID=UPI0021F48D30|nr:MULTISPECIES: GntR family transcriptional regulator [Oceanotoga]MDN5343399.1 hypothetical protein [Oceanotoga sp.]UYP01132.1 GntR family transcriptional regulator [Oceanotoga sp. DSM 15011]
MLGKVDKHSGIPAYIQIMNQIRKETIMGNLKSGDQLPPVREMQKIFGVNINTVTRSLEKLSNEGLIEAQHGVGYFIMEDSSVSDKAINIIRDAVKALKDCNIDLQMSMLLLEEVWKDD